MMEAVGLYAERSHPVLDGLDWTAQRLLDPLPRSQASIKYYFIDYGISTYFSPGERRGLVTGIDGHDEEVPELSMSRPYDPFKVDVFIVGNLFRQLFLNVRPFCFYHSSTHLPRRNTPTRVSLYHLFSR